MAVSTVEPGRPDTVFGGLSPAKDFSTARTLLLLPSRLILFAAFQAIIAAVLWRVNGSFGFQNASIYWPFAALGANIVTIVILSQAFGREGKSLASVYSFARGTVGKDIIATIVVFVIAAPVSFLPSSLLGTMLFGDANATTAVMFGRMPVIAAVATLAFPITIVFAELPLYLGYILPRLSSKTGSRAVATIVVGLFLALQHCTLPLVLDWRFVIWRFGMFLPLALWLAFAFVWRPRLLPYMMIGHGLLDLATVALVISSSLNP